MSKAKAKTTTKPERNEALHELMRGIGGNLDDVEQGLRTLLVLAASGDCDGSDVHWIAMHLHDKCKIVKAALDAADAKYIAPERKAAIARMREVRP